MHPANAHATADGFVEQALAPASSPAALSREEHKRVAHMIAAARARIQEREKVLEDERAALQAARLQLDELEYNLNECETVETVRQGTSHPRWPKRKKQ